MSATKLTVSTGIVPTDYPKLLRHRTLAARTPMPGVASDNYFGRSFSLARHTGSPTDACALGVARASAELLRYS